MVHDWDWVSGGQEDPMYWEFQLRGSLDLLVRLGYRES